MLDSRANCMRRKKSMQILKTRAVSIQLAVLIQECYPEVPQKQKTDHHHQTTKHQYSRHRLPRLSKAQFRRNAQCTHIITKDRQGSSPRRNFSPQAVAKILIALPYHRPIVTHNLFHLVARLWQTFQQPAHTHHVVTTLIVHPGELTCRDSEGTNI